MFQLVFLAAALFLTIEGAIVALWPAWAQRKMANLQEVPNRVLGCAGIFLTVVGCMLASMTDGFLQIACVVVVLEGSLYGLFPITIKKAMARGAKSCKTTVKVYGETALGIGATGLALFL